MTNDAKVRRIRFEIDGSSDDPRGWTNVGLMVGWHQRYTIGDEQPSESPDDWHAALPDGSIVLPLYLYDHSGTTLSTEPFACPWDSGQVGFIVATPEAIAETWRDERPTDEKIREALRSEVKTYDRWMRGDVFGFVVEERDECDSCGDVRWDHLDSCWGFYGDTLEETGALAHIDHVTADQANAAWDQRYETREE